MSAQYVRDHYGVTYKVGDRLTVDGRSGTLVSFPGQYLGIRFDGERHTSRAHPTWKVALATPPADPARRPGEVPERWECGPHANVWNGHDARCRRISVAEPCVICGRTSGTAQPGLCPAHEYDDGPHIATRRTDKEADRG